MTIGSRMVLAAVLIALGVASFMQLKREAPPLRRPREVTAWLADPEQVRRWQESLQRQGVERLLIDFDFGNVLDRVGLDTDGDGRTDLVGIYRNGALVQLARDQNRDARVDDWELIRPSGDPGRIESDSNSDGLVDTWSRLERGVVRSIESDTNADGKVDRWEEYAADGALQRIASDNDGDGRPEQWETYGDQGKMLKTEYDFDGDGKPDHALALGDGS
ncbi:MAG TPA: hypothetical protein VGB99_17465 [Acidobacteriota bacterium]